MSCNNRDAFAKRLCEHGNEHNYGNVFFPEALRYLAQIETVAFWLTGGVLEEPWGVCVCVCARASWNLSCQGYVSIMFSRLWLYLCVCVCVAMMDLQRIGFLLFLTTCRSISFRFSLPSKFNLTYIKRFAPSPLVAKGNQFKVIEL